MLSCLFYFSTHYAHPFKSLNWLVFVLPPHLMPETFPEHLVFLRNNAEETGLWQQTLSPVLNQLPQTTCLLIITVQDIPSSWKWNSKLVPCTRLLPDKTHLSFMWSYVVSLVRNRWKKHSVIVEKHNKGDVVYVIKLGILKWGDYLGLFKWLSQCNPDVITRVLKRGRWEGQNKRKRYNERSRDWVMRPGAKEMRAMSRTRKRQERNGFSPRVSRGNTAQPSPGLLAHWEWVCASDFQKCKKINLCCLEPLRLWWFCLGSSKK